ncbi:hypothetical protein LRS08_00005, partial [Sphingomonas sp. J315]
MSHGTANNQFGYRLGAFAAGVGTIALASSEGSNLGWAAAYGLTGLCIVPGIIAAFWAGAGAARGGDVTRRARASAGGSRRRCWSARFASFSDA